MENKNTVPMLEKALDVLEYIGASTTAVTLPELQANLDIAQASCYRIATTLVRRGWLEKCAGGRYEIAPGLVRVGEKIRFRLEKYRHLQPLMTRLANQIGFSSKFSVRDGDEFVNVCSAQCRSGLLSFSEPGFRSSLREIASVSAVFLSESPVPERNRLIPENAKETFRELCAQYGRKGYCVIHGQPGRNAVYPFDTLSFPVKKGETLLGVISFLSLPGVLDEERDRIARQMPGSLRAIVNGLPE